MLFATGLRKAIDQADPSMAAIMVTAEQTERLLTEKRRRQMIRRHTCSTLKPDVKDLGPVTFFTPSSANEEDKYEPLPPPAAPLSRSPADDWGAGFPLPAAVPTPQSIASATTNAQVAPSSFGGDDFDDEWTDDEDEVLVRCTSYSDFL
ncbi:hypothetical protein DICVIV_08647 [Dictyocaulus viviparus]|uniref:Uncharacterized protein n=1 Tax=Dictyocaulus viviparus TaxID=29172 RepID=A0A0D8XSF5_DICVI|nr:hypothetical protein DICVIV_08647 [Dictyocaulus viviparus]